MTSLLKLAVLVLLAAIAALILFVLVREGIRLVKARRWKKRREVCLKLVGSADRIAVEDLLPLVQKLKTSFPPRLIEDVLDECGSKDLNPDSRKMLAQIYDQLGLIERHIVELHKAKGWTERADAAVKLGKIGHPSAVVPLMTAFCDATEDREVKNAAIRALGNIRDERALDPLIEALGLPDPASGQPLADVILKFGEAAVDPLIKTFSMSERENQRFWTIRILGRLQSVRAKQVLLIALYDHSYKVRAAAALALGHMGAHEGVSQLSKMLLEDPMAEVRDAAAEALGIISDDQALAALQKAFFDLDYTIRRSAMESMEKMGKKAYPFLLDVLMNESSEAAVQASAALERMGIVASWIEDLSGEDWNRSAALLTRVAKTGVVETLARSLKHSNVAVRIRLCRILSEAANPRTFEALVEMAQSDPEWAVRLEAMQALVRLANPTSIPVLTRALGKEEEFVREGLIKALRKAPRDFVESLADAVILLREDANMIIRVETVMVLERIRSKSVFQALLSSLADASPEVRTEAARALRHYSEKEGIKALIGALDDSNRDVRIAAVKSLGRLKAVEAIGPLADGFEKADEGYRDDIAAALASMPIQELYRLTDTLMGLSHSKARAGIAWTLGLIGDEKAISLLQTFLKDPDSPVRAAAAGALGNFRKKEIAPVLVEFLADPNERVRAAVVNALNKCGDPSSVENLLKLLDTEPDAFVCQRIVLAIGRLAALVPKHQAELARKIETWQKSSDDRGVRAAKLIALTLMHDSSSFQKTLEAIHDDKTRPIMRGMLESLPKEVQEHFFSLLSFDPDLFWLDRTEESAKHYSHLLRSSREAGARLNAIEALAMLKTQDSLSAIEYAFAKDPGSKVRSAALMALSKILDGNELVVKIVEAIHDPSEEVRSAAASVLGRLGRTDLEGSRDHLISLFDSQQENIRRTASKVLAGLYRHDWHLLADALLGTQNKLHTMGLIETLGDIGDAKAAHLFIQFMKHDDPEIRAVSALAAYKCKVLSDNQWVSFLSDPDEGVRLTAVRALEASNDPAVLRAIEMLAEDPSEEIRQEVKRLKSRMENKPS